MGKLTLAIGFAAGYVLGAKAGTERYDQIMAKVRELSGRPEVQQAAHTATEKAHQVAETAKAKANETVEKASSKADEKAAQAREAASGGSGSGDVVDLNATSASGARTSDTV